MKESIKSSFYFLSVLWLLPVLTYAAAPRGVPKSVEQLYAIFCNAANWLFAFVIILAVAAFIYAGFLFFTGGGSTENISKAKKLFMYGLLGAGIVVLSKTLVIIVGNFIGVDVTSFLSC